MRPATADELIQQSAATRAQADRDLAAQITSGSRTQRETMERLIMAIKALVKLDSRAQAVSEPQ